MGLLTDFRLTAMEKNLGVYGIHVYQDGKTIAEHRFRSNDRVNLYSAAKTFVAIGVGIAQHEGLLTVTDKVLDFFPEFHDIACAGSERMAVQDLLQMRSGHVEEAFSRYNEMDRAVLFFSAEVEKVPGTHFFYEDLATYMLGRIIEKVSGENALDYMKPRLFAPLGIINPQWHTCGLGHTECSGGLYLTTEEFSRLGIALLGEGCYMDAQIVPAGFVRSMHTDWVDTSAKNDPETRGGYGYQVWNCTVPGAYRADGMYGQICIVLPECRAVVTVTAHNEMEHKDIIRAVWSDVLPHLA